MWQINSGFLSTTSKWRTQLLKNLVRDEIRNKESKRPTINLLTVGATKDNIVTYAIGTAIQTLCCLLAEIRALIHR